MSNLQKLSDKYDTFQIFDPFELICPDSFCFNISGNEVMYRDDDHLSVATAAKLSASLQKLINMAETVPAGRD